MKRLFLLFLLSVVCHNVWAYDFSAVASTGQTLYYKIDGHNAIVTYPGAIANGSAWDGFSKPEGVVTIPESVYYNDEPYNICGIDRYAFANCAGIESINIPGSVRSVGVGAFLNCTGLTTLYFNAYNCTEMGTIGNPVFATCTKLTTVLFADNVTHIPNYAFRRCTSLDNVLISAAVTTIGDRAFELCSFDTVFASGESAPTLGNAVFNADVVTVVPPASLQAYIQKGWPNPTILNRYCVVSAESENPQVGTVYGVGSYNYLSTIMITASPADHYQFSHWNDGDLRNPRPVLVTSDTHFVASFELCSYAIAVYASAGGTVTGGGNYLYGTEATVTAVPNEGYHFVRWQNGSTENPRVFSVEGQERLIATFAENNCVVTLNCDAEKGIVEGAGAYTYPAEVTISATPNDGYQFIRWSDGNTDNPRTFPIVENMTLTATFGTKTYTVQATSDDNGMGTVEGAGAYEYLSTVTLTAIAAEHYRFVKWNDNNTDNPRDVIITQDTQFTALFSGMRYHVFAVSGDSQKGTVTGTGNYFYPNTATITAHPAEHCHFVHWSDGNTDNPRVIDLVHDTQFVATFEYDIHRISGLSNNPDWGSVLGPVEASYMSEITLTANPRPGHIFSRWSDGNTDNPRSIVITQDTSFTAIFTTETPDEYTVSVICHSPEMGSVEGQGTYALNAVATLTAIPNHGYHFTQWNDGNTDNPRNVTVSEDMEFEALFEINTYEVRISSNDENKGSVSGAGEFEYMQEVVVIAQAAEHYHFVKWSDDNTDNPRNLTVEDDIDLIAYFDIDHFQISAVPNTVGAGTVTGSGNYDYGDHVILTAIPAEGYVFVAWSDGATSNPLAFDAKEDLSLTAIFEDVVVGIRQAESLPFTILASGGFITINGIQGQAVRVFDALGRTIFSLSDANQEVAIPTPLAGLYLIQVGDYPMQKVRSVK